VAAAEQSQVEVEASRLPKDLVESGVHQFLLLVMSFRKTGVTELKPALMNALEVEGTDVTSEAICHALYYLTNSDFLYEEVFIQGRRTFLCRKS